MKKIYDLIFSPEIQLSSVLKKSIAGLCFFVSMTAHVTAQVSAYSFSQSAATYVPITGGTVLETATGNTAALSMNSVVHPVSIPFNFNFNGTMYTSLNMSSNGYITFGATTPSTTLTAPLSSTVAFNGVVSAFGRDTSSVFDINGVTGSMSYETVGTAPNRELVIQWRNFRPVSSTSTTNVFTFSFQIRLLETSNIINMVYDNAAFAIGSTAVSGTAQVGLRGLTTADYINRTNATTVEFINSIPGTAVSNTQAFNSTNAIPGMPSAGLTYSWIPPSCFMPTGLAANTVTTTSAQIQWQPTTPTPSTYEVYYGSSSTAPTASTTPTISGITGTSSALSPLNAATAYYVWVRSNCGSTTSAWAPLTFVTLCDVITGAYAEGFEAYPGVGNGSSGGILPNCWTNLGTAQGGHISNSASSVVTGTKGLYLWTSGTTYIAYVALPPMSTLQSGDYRLKFDAKASVTANGILQIGYLDTTNAFVQLTTFSVPTVATVYPFSFDIPALPAGVTQLALKNPGTPANSLSIDNLSYELKSLSTSETDKNRLTVYPNPFESTLTISDIKDVRSIIVTDISGRVVKNISKVTKDLALSDLKTGMYMVTLQLKDGSLQTFKTIKK
ncbi:MAG: T9SS type A sorting domain-containing protein [Kaistella sp.]|nr:T9SS type A sorting domain-containing protein [Kaistella sp.]